MVVAGSTLVPCISISRTQSSCICSCICSWLALPVPVKATYLEAEATTPEYMTQTPRPTEIVPSSQTLSEPDIIPPSINKVFQTPSSDNVLPDNEVTVYANITI